MGQQLSWDHTVHYVNDLDHAVKTFSDAGIHAFLGGSHTEWGTYNALSYFGLTYLEFLAIEKEDQARSHTHLNAVVYDATRLLPKRETISRIALRTNQIEEVAEALTQKGLSVSSVVPGSRKTKEGKWLQWKMLTVHGDFQGVVYPFIIQWGENDEERLSTLSTMGVLQPRPIQLKEAVIYADEPESVANHWANLFNFPSSGSVQLQVGEALFTFQKGDPHQSMELHFETEIPALRGRTIKIGEGTYQF